MLIGTMLRRGLFIAALATAGCTVHAAVGYRVYDPYYSDYHVWDGGEVGYYNRWAGETHRDAHRDFRRLSHRDQQDYFKWRPDHR